MRSILIAFTTLCMVTGCGLNDFPAMKPIGKKSFADVSSLISVIQCDLKAGADYAARNELKWVNDIRYAVDFDLTVTDSQSFVGGATISTPLAGGLILLTGSLSNKSKSTRSHTFDMIVDTTKIKSCPTQAERPIKGALGLVEWQTWLIDKVNSSQNRKDVVPFEPHKATFSVSFEIDNSGGLGPRFANTGAGALDSGTGALSRGRKTTHKIVVVASSLFDRPKKTTKDREEQNQELLQDLQQRVLRESLRGID